MLALALLALSAQTLKVGPGQPYPTIESAVAGAQPGDTVEVYPQPGGYHRTAIRITTANVSIIGTGDSPVLIDGEGFDYSGVGKIPRAIFQIDPGADGVTIRNLELIGAHNGSYNGSGVRINGANEASIVHCDIHGNDMGIMSAGNGPNAPARMQGISECHIHHNGAIGDPGYNHNLYLDGYSVTLRRCEIDHSITGHNLKSRAFDTEAFDCYIHDAANREVDMVESLGTVDNSRGVLMNCVIAKDPKCVGNRVVVHFGKEKGHHRGTLYVVGCTILTPFASPVILLSDPEASAQLVDSIVLNTEQRKPALFEGAGGATHLSGRMNWLSTGYDWAGTCLDASSTLKGEKLSDDLGIAPPTFTPSGVPKSLVPGFVTWRDFRNPSSMTVSKLKRIGAIWKPL